jgi:peptidoglycan/xylan/chitin deacetylase (PgdA/CDA1 family)
MDNKIKSQLSKLNFLLGFNPRLEKSRKDYKKYLKGTYKAVCLISADFEMAWAFCHSKKSLSEPGRAVKLGLHTRANMPRILDLCEQYDIPITWATVGHLFLNKCGQGENLAHVNLPHIPYFSNEFWEFTKGDWFDPDPCTDIDSDPAWYGADLIDNILSRKVKHEIGCHTFSHIDCSDKRCPDVVFEAEIRECLELAKEKGQVLRSFVHPGHQIGHLKALAELGFDSYRTDYGNNLALPEKADSGLWQLKNTAEINYRRTWPASFNLYYYKKIIDRAIKYHKMAVIWFHPSFNPEVIDKVIRPLFQYLYENRNDIWVTTHSQLTEFLNTTHKE